MTNPYKHQFEIGNTWTLMDYWEDQLQHVLEMMLKSLEKGDQFPYRDTWIDIETHCRLIQMLREKIIARHTDGVKYTEMDVKKHFRGGYDVDLEERLIKALCY